MTAAGVQNVETSAYFPPPATSSPAEAKDTPAADSQPGKPQDFQSELALQDTVSEETSQGTEPAGRPATSPGKPGKKPEGRVPEARLRDDQSAGAPLLVAFAAEQVAKPAKEILPLVLALPKPDEDAKADEQAGKAGVAVQGAAVQDDNQVQALPLIVAPNQAPAANATPIRTPDSAKDPIPPLVAVFAQPEAQPEAMKPENQSATSGKQGKPSPNELRLAETTPPEPVATAIQETKDSGQSSPSALAFAARMAAFPQAAVPQAAVPQKADDSTPRNPSEPSAAPGSRAPGRIPMRYAATAQILQNVGDRLAKNAGTAADRGPQAGLRTDLLIPRVENVREAAPSSGPSAQPQAAPTTRTERIIEPPAQPPTSAHDIRVQVPDNKGGSTQVRFVESGGEVRVSVRTADEGLAQNLRTHLNDLTQRLADEGIPAEFWKPAAPSGSPQNNHSQPDHSQPDRQGRGSDGQQSGGQDAKQDQQQKRPAWLEEMEASLHVSGLKR